MSKIQEKVAQLKKKGFNLGKSHGPEKSAGFGGWVQEFDNANIYWHSVMGKTACEVHGGIRSKYLQLGGSSNRHLGFPVTDEQKTVDGSTPVSHFEWGSIYYVRGMGGIDIHGQIFKKWKNLKRKLSVTDPSSLLPNSFELSPLGLPISRNTSVSGGEGAVFQRGCLWERKGSEAVFYAHLDFPLLGNPKFINPKNTNELVVVKAFTRRHRVPGLVPQPEPKIQDVKILSELLDGRIVLQPAENRSSGLIRLHISKTSIDGLRFSILPADLVKFRNKTLYNIVFHRKGNKRYNLSPHAIYITDSPWNNFSFIHITDIHVAARPDRLYKKLERLEKSTKEIDKRVSRKVTKHYNNFNERFREFIRYANRLHALGRLDFIIATGDLVDYLYENTDNKYGRGNFGRFKDIILGKGNSPYGTKNEELHVPIFTTLGNHDYRTNPYRLVFKVSLKIAGRSVKELTSRNEFGPYNLTLEEALALEGKKSSFPGLPPHYRRPNLGKDAGFKAVKIDWAMRQRNSFYFREINSEKNYVIPLGDRNRIAMIDTGPDSGVTNSSWDGFLHIIGQGDSETEKFIGGFTNSVGFDDPELNKVVKRAIKEARQDGLIIVGMHSPPLNHANHEYSHFFRETEYANVDPYDIWHFLTRNHPPGYMAMFRVKNGNFIAKSPNANRPLLNRFLERGANGWSTAGKKYFKIAPKLDDPIAEGVADGSIKFLRICLGSPGLSRRVNLVLCGHNHSLVEYRLDWDSRKKEIEFYTDYYMENPLRYYSSREHSVSPRKVFPSVKDALIKPGRLMTGDHRGGASRDYVSRSIPPYNDTLNKTERPKEWWGRHSPIICQTASLGPVDRNQRDGIDKGDPPEQTFQGARIIKVNNNLITSIRFISTEEIQKAPTIADKWLEPVLNIMMN